ncbi:MAG: response regulator [Chloroherpetonaceae bacterium]|nr:response regulator [Chloroherpetonaceae bacterium]MDW8437449.1 response regulator [Chloroherpetonaceae bacterium]
MTKKTILVADDEDLIRELLADALSDDFNVLVACDGEAAFALYERHRDEVALVITDLIMPNLRGDELAEKLRASRPNLPIIFISGYEGEIQTQALLAKGNSAFLQKPFDIESLMSALRDVL